jgi:hypothetical protein
MKIIFARSGCRKHRIDTGGLMLKDKKIFLKMAGVILAIFGTVIVIHAVPVYVWYLSLALLIFFFAYLMLYQ